MRTLLINAPYPFAECPTLPLGLCYLAAVLEEKGHEVEILDMVVSKFSPQRIKEKIQEFKPDVCGAGPVTMNYPTALRALKVCNEMGAMTVMGGCHVTFWDEECLNEAPYIDVIVRREGEYTLLDLVEGKDLKDILGITYREDGKIVVNPDRPLIQNLDELPFPARYLLPLAKYHAYKVGASMITARGCPYHCIFCVGHKMVGAKARYRDPKLVVDEMEVIMGQGFDDICVEDDQLTMNHKHVYAICDEILNRGLKIKWCAFSRCDTVTPDLVKRMSEAGCYYFCYAESGDDRILELARKRQTREKLRKGVKIAKDSGVKVLASFIMGLPGETPQTMKESMEFGNELDTAHGFHILSPFPGTEVRERAKEFGLRILHSNWLRYDANQAVTESDEVPKELLNKTVNDFNYNLEGLIRDQQKEVEEGTLNTPEAKEDYLLRKRRTLAWRLLKNDRIERHGKLENNGEDPKKLLADEIYSIKAVSDALSREWVEWGLTQLINEGLLECTKDDHTITWKWADIGKGKVKAKKVESKIEQRK